MIKSKKQVKPSKAKEEKTSKTKSVKEKKSSDDGLLSVKLEKGKIVISAQTWKGKDKIDIRYYYEKDGKYAPSPTGISIPEEVAVAVYKKYRKLLKERGLLEWNLY